MFSVAGVRAALSEQKKETAGRYQRSLSILRKEVYFFFFFAGAFFLAFFFATERSSLEQDEFLFFLG